MPKWLGLARFSTCFGACCVGMAADAAAARPPLPARDGTVEIEVRDGAAGSAARALPVHLVYPGGCLDRVTARTGLMLSLHNWGGTVWDNTPNPNALAQAYDLVVIGVTYYQSGALSRGPEPYDFGYRQAMDALRALHYVWRSLQDGGRPFDLARLYSTGGSGGGNVTHMAAKFAPATFACIVDLSGMSSLSDDIAYGLPGGSGLSARYSRDPASPAWLSPDMQQIRDLGHLGHLAVQARHANGGRIVVIHGEEDRSCPAPDKHRVVDAMRAAGLDAEAHFITPADVDGQLIRDAAHQIGDRTRLLMHFAGKYLDPASPELRRLAGPSDFARRGAIEYPTDGGVHVVSFAGEVPALIFRPAASPPGAPP